MASGATAVEFLGHSVDAAVFHLRKKLNQLLAEPAMARFAMVEEFTDLLLRREGAKKEWRQLMDGFRDLFWPEKFKQAESEAGLHQQWLTAVLELEQLTRNPAIRLRSQ